jgi:hypothetical protein
MSSPPPLFFLSSCPFLLFDRAAGFLPPRPRIGVGRRAQMLSRLAALQRPHPAGASAFTASSNDGRLDRVDYTPSLLFMFICFGVIARYSDHGCCFRQVLLRSPWRVRCSHQLISGSSDPACQGAACMDDRAGGMGLIFGTADRQVPICDSVLQPHIRPARHTRDWGVGTRRSVDVIE